MSRAVVILRSPSDYQKAEKWLRQAPKGASVEFKAPRRNLDQNALLWVKLGELSRQVEWYGAKLSADDWKDVLTASLRRARVVPGIDQGSFVPLGMRTSDMTKQEFGELLDLIDVFAAERGVVFSADERAA